MKFTQIDDLSVQATRSPSIDIIERANSGHPGLPMGAAPIAYVLWTRHMQFNPRNPDWFNRDRFVLSAGHGSVLLYCLPHLTGYDVSIDDLKSYREWGSNTPGHPEHGVTCGVDATTGPLGKGLVMAVGMAIAERFLAVKFNTESSNIIDHYIYVLASDGDMMEGVSSEAASLAGYLGLNKLIVLYDSNDVSLDGPTSWSFTENVAKRFQAYGWNVLRVEDGNNLSKIDCSLYCAKYEMQRPTLIEVKTIIGYGAPKKQGTKAAHGEPLGTEEALRSKETYGWKYPDFFVPDEVYSNFADCISIGKSAENQWLSLCETYKHLFPVKAQEFETALNDDIQVPLQPRNKVRQALEYI